MHVALELSKKVLQILHKILVYIQENAAVDTHSHLLIRKFIKGR